MAIKTLLEDGSEFPMIVELNFKMLLDKMANYDGNDTTMQKLAEQFLADEHLDPLKNGLRSYEEIEANKDSIAYLMETLFPYALGTNEIKSASVPFTNINFHYSDRFRKILEAAGPDFELTTRNMNLDNAYIFGCSLILLKHYNYRIDFRRPFYYDIPDANGEIRNYRVLYNGDFMEILPTQNTIPITDEDVALLIDNFDDIDLWKEKFPPNTYLFRGFGIANVFDVTLDESISDIKTSFIYRSSSSFVDVEKSIRRLYGENDIHLGITRYDHESSTFISVPDPKVHSLLLGDLIESRAKDALCTHWHTQMLEHGKTITISDIEKYGAHTNYNQFYRHLKQKGFKSYLCAPMIDDGKIIGVIELGSSIHQFLNSINATKLEDITPILSIVMKRAQEDHKNMLEVIIQEECTSIHPAVAWKFEEAAEEFFRSKLKNEEAVFQEIVFEEVFPLYGQCDIRGSSDARNLAIQKDLIEQLSAAEGIINQAQEVKDLPIFKELKYRLKQYENSLKDGLGAGADQQILDFLQTDVYPVFSHLQHESDVLRTSIESYMSMLNADLKMVYNERKNYDQSVMQINKHLASYLDERAHEAQNMFPHFFERYKTDGVEYNIYIGQSLVKDKTYSPLYLQNLKLWQLTTMCQLERHFQKIKPVLSTPLDIASLILAHSTPLAIRFRMDEKQFDVDGAYNARYEIVKKRIDKSYIKGSSERLTQPGMLSIVYSQQSERIEYDKYAEYLRALGYIKGKVEYHILEDLQGITGLRAMRYHVNFDSLDEEDVKEKRKHKVSAN